MSDMSKREFETVLAYFQAKIVCSDMNGAPCRFGFFKTMLSEMWATAAKKTPNLFTEI